MSIHRAAATPSPSANPHPPGILPVRPGNFVIIRSHQHITEPVNDDWWMGQILWCEGAIRERRVNVLLQVANVDDGALHWVKADAVTHVVHALDGIGDEQ